MTYAGLTISDKPALREAKARGAEWAARDGDDYSLYFYIGKPYRSCCGSYWACVEVKDSQCIAANRLDLPFIQWSDAEPVNIDLALAQIAEMESAEKPQDCEYCAKLSKYAGWGYAEWFEQRAVDDVYEISVEVKFCPNCGNQLASPYTEGEKK